MNWSEWFFYDETSPTCLRRRKVNPNDKKNKEGDVAGHIGGDGYYIVKLNNKPYCVHRIIWEMFNQPLRSKEQVDHKDRDRLNNKKDNLRVATNLQNCKNRSKNKSYCSSLYKGVAFLRKTNKWSSRIRVNYEFINIGNFDTEEEAAEMYDNAAVHFHGEFAHLNFGMDGYKKRCQDLLPS